MSKTIALLFVFLLATTATSQPRTKAQRVSAEQRLVEEAADRVMRRFYETLDFGTVYRELFVSNPLKEKEVRITVGYVLQAGMPLGKFNDAARTLDFAPLERAYLASKQFNFLVSAENFTYDGDEEKFRKELEAKMKPYYMTMMEGVKSPIKTSDELYDRFTANFEELNSLLRQYVVPRNYNSDFYRSRVAKFEETKPPVSRIKDIFGLREKLYVAQRERLHLYFVRENGAFKMLTVTSRVMD
jgi:hypothetical protein